MDTKQLEADFQNYIDACNKLRNSAKAIWETEMKEDPTITNDFPYDYLVARSKYLNNVGNIGGCARAIRDSVTTQSMRQSLKEIKEHLSVTANKAGD